VTYRVQAFNTATASTNKIHDDAVAQQLGFRGGLVPGVDVFAYLCHVPAERWGRAWLESGTIKARFTTPVYDGDEVEVRPAWNGDDHVELALVDPAEVLCATATAALLATAAVLPNVADWPSGPPPDVRPPASLRSLTAGPLGSIAATFHADRATDYLDDIREHLPLFRDEGLAHPGWLLRFANYVLSTNVALGPWIHVSSSVVLLHSVGDGDVVETRALVTDVYERGGHRFVDLDVLQVVGERPVTRTAHTAIYEPRGVTAAG
jgi:hypothetical protein